MGEYADLLLEGDACQVCGVNFLTPGDGYPRTCRACRREENKAACPQTLKCPQCQKKVKRVGLAAHMAAKHGS